ncbi:hypothetical protein V8C86DRAFT_2521032 [Haematococcus lacustris]
MSAQVNVGQSVPHMDKAWEFFRKMVPPRFRVAPIVDQSELPFRMLCRKYGATCAYTPMLHARLFCEDSKYSLAAEHADAVDINFGCPQRIAK